VSSMGPISLGRILRGTTLTALNSFGTGSMAIRLAYGELLLESKQARTVAFLLRA
jgi:hypothetical protein